MARRRRLKYSNPDRGYYHLITRTSLAAFLLDDVAKEEFMRILRKLSQVYFVKVVTFALMSNHVHLIVRMQASETIHDKDLEQRLHLYYNAGRPKKRWRIIDEKEYPAYRKRFGDLSSFMQDLKQRFSRWHNKRTRNHGTIWGERFTSVLLEPGRALSACMAYVDLNALRAGIVKRPEDYRWSGLSHYVAGGRAASWLDHETFTTKMWWRVEARARDREIPELKDDTEQNRRIAMVKRYLMMVYEAGSVDRYGKAAISDGMLEKEYEEDFYEVGVGSLSRRMHHFSRGVFLGSKGFCGEMFHEFRDYFVTRRERRGHPVLPASQADPGGLLDIHAIRQFGSS